MVRKRRALTVLVAISLLAVIAGAAVAGEKPAAMEKMAWEAWANNDAAALGEFLAEGHIWIGSDGITIGKDENTAPGAGGSCAVKSYELGEITAHTVAEDVVILTYEATQDATCDGARLPEHVYCSSVWVEKDGEWHAALYHETAATE